MLYQEIYDVRDVLGRYRRALYASIPFLMFIIVFGPMMINNEMIKGNFTYVLYMALIAVVGIIAESNVGPRRSASVEVVIEWIRIHQDDKQSLIRAENIRSYEKAELYRLRSLHVGSWAESWWAKTVSATSPERRAHVWIKPHVFDKRSFAPTQRGVLIESTSQTRPIFIPSKSPDQLLAAIRNLPQSPKHPL